MSDIELLEMAAKACGYDHRRRVDDRIVIFGRFWNPLDSDGDAFRAANAKGISIIHEYPGHVLAKRIAGGEWFKAFVNDPNDYDRSARLAIVHVLAEIGSAMP